MPRKTPEYYANVARQTQERTNMRSRYREYLEAHGFENSENSAHSFAMSLSLGADARVKLVSELLSAF